MTSAPAMPRYIHCLVFLIILSACRDSAEPLPVRVVDLAREFDRAEKRPPGTFQISDYRVGDIARPSIVAPVPSRLTWSLPLPRHGIFHAFVALADAPGGTARPAVRLRVGISDHRTYEGLSDIIVAPGDRGWTDVRADLSAYAGWKWSLFYRPDRVTWRVVLATDATGDAPAMAVWGSPEIVTDTQSAREYAARRQRR
jgi:hypothetical protein